MIDDREPEQLPTPADPGEGSDDEFFASGAPVPRKQRESKVERELREADEFWRAVLSSVVGRRELWRLFCGPSGAHAFETRFPVDVSGAADASAVWYEKGVQDFGLRTYRHWVGVDRRLVLKMHEENDPVCAGVVKRARVESV